MKIVEGGVVPETIQVLKNLVAILEASGSSVENVIKANIYLDDISNFTLVNDEYKKGILQNIFHFVRRVTYLLSLLQLGDWLISCSLILIWKLEIKY